jgi:hypothetical protein
MAEGNSTFMGLGVPLSGEFEVTQKTLANDILTITGKSGQTGDFLVCQNSSGTEKVVVDSSGNMSLAGKVTKMVLGTIALATLASDASAEVALVGLTTSCVVGIIPRAALTTKHIPNVWVHDADVLGYGAGGVTTAACTVNYWYFATA